MIQQQIAQEALAAVVNGLNKQRIESCIDDPQQGPEGIGVLMSMSAQNVEAGYEYSLVVSVRRIPEEQEEAEDPGILLPEGSHGPH